MTACAAEQQQQEFLVRPVDTSSSDVVVEVEEVERAWSDVQLDKSGWSYFIVTQDDLSLAPYISNLFTVSYQQPDWKNIVW